MKAESDAVLKPEQAAYLESIEAPRDELLVEMEAYAKEHGLPISDPEVASFLAVTARSARPETIVEVGTNIGYGAIVLARAAGDSARVFSIEKSPDLCKTARAYVERAGLDERVEVKRGDAIEELEAFRGTIDLAYVDCVKEDYVRYFDILVPKLAPRGLLIADNVLWRGMVASAKVPADDAKKVEALRAFNQKIVSDPRLRGVVLPLGDGVAYAVRV